MYYQCINNFFNQNAHYIIQHLPLLLPSIAYDKDEEK